MTTIKQTSRHCSTPAKHKNIFSWAPQFDQFFSVILPEASFKTDTPRFDDARIRRLDRRYLNAETGQPQLKLLICWQAQRTI